MIPMASTSMSGMSELGKAPAVAAALSLQLVLAPAERGHAQERPPHKAEQVQGDYDRVAAQLAEVRAHVLPRGKLFSALHKRGATRAEIEPALEAITQANNGLYRIAEILSSLPEVRRHIELNNMPPALRHEMSFLLSLQKPISYTIEGRYCTGFITAGQGGEHIAFNTADHCIRGTTRTGEFTMGGGAMRGGDFAAHYFSDAEKQGSYKRMIDTAEKYEIAADVPWGTTAILNAINTHTGAHERYPAVLIYVTPEMRLALEMPRVPDGAAALLLPQFTSLAMEGGLWLGGESGSPIVVVPRAGDASSGALKKVLGPLSAATLTHVARPNDGGALAPYILTTTLSETQRAARRGLDAKAGR